MLTVTLGAHVAVFASSTKGAHIALNSAHRSGAQFLEKGQHFDAGPLSPGAFPPSRLQHPDPFFVAEPFEHSAVPCDKLLHADTALACPVKNLVERSMSRRDRVRLSVAAADKRQLQSYALQ